MKTCRVKPGVATCKACLEIQQMFSVIDECAKCNVNTRTYELISVGVYRIGFLDYDYAFVLSNGIISKVALSRVYDVKEVSMINNIELLKEDPEPSKTQPENNKYESGDIIVEVPNDQI